MGHGERSELAQGGYRPLRQDRHHRQEAGDISGALLLAHVWMLDVVRLLTVHRLGQDALDDLGHEIGDVPERFLDDCVAWIESHLTRRRSLASNPGSTGSTNTSTSIAGPGQILL